LHNQLPPFLTHALSTHGLHRQDLRSFYQAPVELGSVAHISLFEPANPSRRLESTVHGHIKGVAFDQLIIDHFQFPDKFDLQAQETENQRLKARLENTSQSAAKYVSETNDSLDMLK